jgi:hypothetical protein
MNELLQAATRAFNAIADVAEYALAEERKKNGETAPTNGLDRAVNLAETITPKTARKPRAPKNADEAVAKPHAEDRAARAEAADDIMGLGAGAKAAPAPVEMTEAESKAKAEAVARTFVLRFKDSTPSGVERAKTILKEKFGVERMGDLVHDKRVGFIKALELELSAAN